MGRDRGADLAVNYRDQDFVAAARDAFGGADVILDLVGGSYLARNLEVLNADGRLSIIAHPGGSTAEIDLNLLLRKRLTVHAAGLRARPLAQKAAIVAGVRADV